MRGRQKKRKSFNATPLLILVFLIGLSLLLYPTVSDYVNAMHQTKEIASYEEEIIRITDEEFERLQKDARQFNARIQSRKSLYALTDAEIEEYENLLDITNSGVMGYIEIPSLEVSIPIYHGTSETVLQRGIGHLEWTSLPVGGDSTHCVLSGHRGLPSAKLFTNLDRLEFGDEFMLRVLNEVLTYEVDQILIVEPKDTDALKIVEGSDYCTLVTCTPYGINTHRLLVRGHRVENRTELSVPHLTADAVSIEPMLVAAALFAGVLLIVLIMSMFLSGETDTDREEKKKQSQMEED